MDQETRKCPMCAEFAPADAVLCPYCGTRFDSVPQAASPALPPAPPQPAPQPAPQVISPQATPSGPKTGLWIGAGILLVILVIAGVLIWNPRLRMALGIEPATATPTASLTPSLTSTPTLTSTRTPRPSPTLTPQPEWVSDFAQPILDAVSQRAPDFEDDFGAGSAGWFAPGGCGSRMAYVDGEMVVTDCSLSRPGINFKDFVIEFDARLMPGVDSDSTWALHYRIIGGLRHSIRVLYTGTVTLEFYNAQRSESFPRVARAGNESNHFLVIARGATIAIFINDIPLYSTEEPAPTSGDFQFFADDNTALGIDNVKVWNLGNLDLP
jgi:hypothetical protein